METIKLITLRIMQNVDPNNSYNFLHNSSNLEI